MNGAFFLRWVQQGATEEVEQLSDKKCLSLYGGVVIVSKEGAVFLLASKAWSTQDITLIFGFMVMKPVEYKRFITKR